MEEQDFKTLLENNKIYILGDVTGFLGDKTTKSLLTKQLTTKNDLLKILKVTDKEKGVISFAFKLTTEVINKFDAETTNVDKSVIGKLVANDISRDICQELIDIALVMIEKRNEVKGFDKLTRQQKEKLTHITTVSTVIYMPNKDVFDLTYYF